MSTRRKPPSRNPARQVTATGLQVEARHVYGREVPPPPPGQHAWMVVGMWRLTDPTSERFELDLENLTTLQGPFCWACEQPHTAELAATTCPGEPR